MSSLCFLLVILDRRPPPRSCMVPSKVKKDVGKGLERRILKDTGLDEV
jgi:hypothetical protein